jgi:hypothetical protein
MDFKRLKEKYAGKLCLFGCMNVETLIDGSDGEIRAEVEYALKYAAPGGCLVFTSGNILEPCVTAAKYAVATEAWCELSSYAQAD